MKALRQFFPTRTRGAGGRGGMARRAFTLLEMLLVVVILSATAWMLTASVTDDIAQVRYDDTRNRLTAIRGAILGPTSVTALERGLLSGYVVDNGVLPECINDLVSKPDDYAEFGATYPVFGYDSANAHSFPTDTAQFQFMKGFRGAYVASINNKFRDGWGNVSSDKTNDDDADNHGWNVDPTGRVPGRTKFVVESYGMDGAPETITANNSYEEDMAMSPSIGEYDWQVPVQAVEVRNLTNNDFPSIKWQVALLVYKNDKKKPDGASNDDNFSWKWETFGMSESSGGVTAAIAIGDKQPVPFSKDCKVPIGEHLLVLVANGSPNLSSDPAGTPKYVTKRVRFHSRENAPPLVLEIR